MKSSDFQLRELYKILAGDWPDEEPARALILSIFSEASESAVRSLENNYPYTKADRLVTSFRQGSLKWNSFQKSLRELEKKNLKLAKKKLDLTTKLVFAALQNNFLRADETAAKLKADGYFNYNSFKIQWIKDSCSFLPENMSDEQLSAIGNCDDTVLLRARAGSGKTTVIKHKVDFAIRHLGFDPGEIMVLAFNNTAALKVKKELQSELNQLTFNNSRTFHSLAYNIVQPTQELLFDVDKASNAKQSQFVEGLIAQENNPKFCKDMYEFFRLEIKQMENIGSLLSKEDYRTFLRNSAQDTLKGDPVKSLGEKWIADFLFEHDIRYMYERAWYRDKSGEKGNYHPDFSLAVNSNAPDVVIEHWGIDELDGSKSVPEHWNQSWSEYRADMEVKRDYWKNWNENYPNRPVTFLETSIRDICAGRSAFESHLKQLLSRVGVVCTKLPEEELIERVVRKRVARFSGMCLQFIQRAKKQCLNPDDLDAKISTFDFSCEKEKVFCLIANRIYHRYTFALEDRNLIDFDDLMSQAVDCIEQKQGNVVIEPTSEKALDLNTLKWLMVDEYQDFSSLFFNLVKALRTYNPALKLFCVGDDWQAVNGFAGSDLIYFHDFEQYFPGSTMLDLQNNYRSQPNIVGQGNAFMARTMGAPSIPKADLLSKPIQVIYANTIFIEQRQSVPIEDNLDRRYLTFLESRGEYKNADIGGKLARMFKACHSIISSYPLDSTNFMILNRKNSMGFSYRDMNGFKKKLKSCFEPDQLKNFRNFDAQVDCLTAHRAKGEEADVVIVLNAIDRAFPQIHPDNELYRLLGLSLDEVYAEEERLFYVAITRAKKFLYIVTEVGRESDFLDRIEWDQLELPKTNTSISQVAMVQEPANKPFTTF